MCKVSSESAKLGFEETVKVEPQVPKAGGWDVVTDNNSKGLEKLYVMSPAPVTCIKGRITCYFTCNVNIAFTVKVCSKTLYHRVK